MTLHEAAEPGRRRQRDATKRQVEEPLGGGDGDGQQVRDGEQRQQKPAKPERDHPLAAAHGEDDEAEVSEDNRARQQHRRPGLDAEPEVAGVIGAERPGPDQQAQIVGPDRRQPHQRRAERAARVLGVGDRRLHRPEPDAQVDDRDDAERNQLDDQAPHHHRQRRGRRRLGGPPAAGGSRGRSVPAGGSPAAPARSPPTPSTAGPGSNRGAPARAGDRATGSASPA